MLVGELEEPGERVRHRHLRDSQQAAPPSVSVYLRIDLQFGLISEPNDLSMLGNEVPFTHLHSQEPAAPLLSARLLLRLRAKVVGKGHSLYVKADVGS